MTRRWNVIQAMVAVAAISGMFFIGVAVWVDWLLS